jgi:hypothetical protein
MEKATAWSTKIEKGLLTSMWPGWGTLHAECTQFIKKPGKMKLDQDYSVYDHPFFFTYYFNAGEAWVMINLGVRQHPRYTTRLADKMKTIDGLPYYLSACDTFFVVADVPDDSLMSAADIERVGIVDQGDTVYIDLSRTSHLPVRRIEDGGTRHILFDDYRPVDGITMPFHITLYEEGRKASEYAWESITLDAPIDDAIFEEYRPEPKMSSE